MDLEHLWHFENQAGYDDTVAENLSREVLQAPILIVKEVAAVETILAEKAVNEFVLFGCRLLVLDNTNVATTAACQGYLLLVGISEHSHQSCHKDHGERFHLNCLFHWTTQFSSIYGLKQLP